MNLFRIIPFLLMLVLSTGLKAQDSLLTVEGAIATALKNNYDIQLLRQDSVITAMNSKYAKGLFLPNLNAATTYIFNNNNAKQKLADGSERSQNSLRSNNLQSSINLNWKIFDGFKMFITRDKYEEMNKLSNLSIQELVINKVAEVINTYYSIVRQKQQVTAINEQMLLNEERLKLAEKKLGVGLGAKPEILQARLDLNAQKVNKISQLSLIEQIKVDLNKLMNVPEDAMYDVSDSIPIHDGLTAAEMIGTAEAKNLTLQMIEQTKRVAEFTLKEARADRFPILNFVSAYNYNRLNNQTAINPFTPLFNRNNGFNYGLSISIPILNNFNVRKNIDMAKAEISYQDLRYELEKQSLRSGITKAFKNYLLHKNILDLENENIKLARENVYISTERLRLGITTVLELRETQKSLEDAYNRLIAARYNAKLAETELLRLNGSLLEPGQIN